MKVYCWKIAEGTTSRRGIQTIIGKDEARRAQKDYRKTHQNMVNICWNCGLDASRLEGRQLRACSACKAVGRGIRYCSSECQKQDWKHGRPVPHKSICGKKDTDLDEPGEIQIEPQDDGDQRIPKADPGFKRSTDLLHQISFLNKPPYVDYVVMQPYPADDVGISLPSPFLREQFLIMRQRALRNGDPGCVHTMLFLLGYMVNTPRCPVSIEHVRAQLSGSKHRS
ncbi:hypothetical protein BD779DRAFT_341569 [Infundibulicybe gibba]|nr:hypothetical protein BD779DRAFT_341569 [Infundibulicybe gibba]